MGIDNVEVFRTHPTALAQVLWPDVMWYDKQVEIIKAVDESYETYVHAGNMLGT